MLPERLVVSLVVLPVDVHVRQQVGLAIRLERASDVGRLSSRITVLLVRPVAVVGPQA
jgi:hypothetical protein